MDQKRPVPKPRPRPRKTVLQEEVSHSTNNTGVPYSSHENARNSTYHDVQNVRYIPNSMLYGRESQQTDNYDEEDNPYSQSIVDVSLVNPVMRAVQRPPQIQPRKPVVQDFDLMPSEMKELRKKLLTLIRENASQETNKSVVLKILEFDGDFNDKYDSLQLKKILRKNEETNVQKISVALRLLGKYASNLLKEENERHHSWRKINFNTKGFKNVRPLQGNGQILKDIGYTVPFTSQRGEEGLAYQDEKPNLRKVENLALDLSIARFEVEEIASGKHPHLKKLKDVDGIPNVFFVKTDSMGEVSSQLDSSLRGGDGDSVNKTHMLLLSKPATESEIIKSSKTFVGLAAESEIQLYNRGDTATIVKDDPQRFCKTCKILATGRFCSNCGNELSTPHSSPRPSMNYSSDVITAQPQPTSPLPDISHLHIHQHPTPMKPHIYDSVSPEGSPTPTRKPVGDFRPRSYAQDNQYNSQALAGGGGYEASPIRPPKPQLKPKPKPAQATPQPPPTQPPQQQGGGAADWVCKHCTFVNKAGTNVCDVCMKTSWVHKAPDQLVEEAQQQPGGGGGGGTGGGGGASGVDAADDEPELLENHLSEEEEEEEEEKVEEPENRPSQTKRQNSGTEGRMTRLKNTLLNTFGGSGGGGGGVKPEHSTKKEAKGAAAVEEAEIEMEQVKSHDIESFCVVDDLPKSPKKDGGGGVKEEEKPKSHLEKTMSHDEKMKELLRQNDIEKEHRAQEQREKEKRESLNRAKRDKERQETEDLIKIFQTAEKKGFTVDECNVGVLQLGDAANEQSIQAWLCTTWQHIVKVTTKRCNEELNNNKRATQGELLGLVPEELVKKYLVKMDGDQAKAIDAVTMIRKQQFIKLQEQYKESIGRDELVNVLTETQGSLKECRKKLNSKLLAKFIERSVQPYDEEKILKRLGSTDITLETKCIMLLGEGYVTSWGVAINICKLMEMKDIENSEVSDYIMAGKSSNMLDRCKKYLKHDCQACYDSFPVNKILSSTTCACELCQDCFLQSLKVNIESEDINNLKCGFCDEPVVFAHLETQIKHYVNVGMMDKKCLDIFNTKLLDAGIENDPNFRYCMHCNNGYGFVWDNLQTNKMRCDKCSRYSCFQCQKAWSGDHEGRTCEELEQYIFLHEHKDEKNVAAIFDRTQLDCPNCKAQFELARGGCMHFTCQKCKFQFCGGCSQEFADSKKDQKTANCNDSCKPKGFHTHHPRDCNYYLRDNIIKQLQKLLRINEIPFETEVDENRQDQAIVCNVNEMKEEQVKGDDGEATFRHFDGVCGKETADGQAGVCEKHYKEYLGILVNRYGVDPVEICETNEIAILYVRHNKQIPDKRQDEQNEEYTRRLVEAVKIDIPLPKRKTMMHPKEAAALREGQAYAEQQLNVDADNRDFIGHLVADDEGDNSDNDGYIAFEDDDDDDDY